MSKTFGATGIARGLGTAAVLLWAGFAAAADGDPVPPEIRVDATQAPFMTLAAKGVQIYECRASSAAGAETSWVLVAPEAELADAQGARFGSHGAGPTWQATDGSAVAGTAKARVDAPVRDAIPWLLLQTKSTGGPGKLAAVTSIQRVNTVGGAAPAQGCDKASVGTKTRVPYTADYRLFVTR